MNPTSPRLLRLAAISTLLAAWPTFTFAANQPPARLDAAMQQLTAQGRVPVKAAGRYVEIGTFQVQVSTKLGQPTYRLVDGNWLYENFSVDGSEATGALLVRFARGRVSELALVSRAAVVALRSSPRKGSETILAIQER